jgi:putative ABC transport system permease protein
LAERAHELATLRVLGFTRAEVGFVLVGELMLLTALGVAPGWVAGYGFAAFISRAMSSDIVALPLVIEMRSYAVAGVVVLLAALITALVVRRRLDRVDLVSALKQRE